MNPHQKELDALRRQVAELNEKLAAERRAQKEPPGIDALRSRAFTLRGRLPKPVRGTRPTQLLVLLYDNPNGLTREQILHRLPPVSGREDERDLHIINVWAAHARKGLDMPTNPIANVYGIGYSLTPVGRAFIQQLLAPAPQYAPA